MPEIELHEDYEAIDAENVALFAKYGTRSGSKRIHRCVICGGDTCIDEGYSAMGHNFVCGDCAWDSELFDTPLEVLYWLGDVEMPREGGYRD